jgi:hypothetical protein
MLWSTGYEFPDLLVDLRNDLATANKLRADLLSELSAGHVLYGRELTVVALGPVDELIVEVDQQSVALVHLVWSGHTERPPYPETEMLDSSDRLEDHLKAFNSRRQR